MATVSDPIADLLTRIRNGASAQLRFVDIPLSKMKASIAEILKNEGFIADFLVKEEEGKGTIRVFLKYTAQRQSIIKGLKRVSKCGLRRYVRAKDIPYIFGGMGVSIISTPRGVMTGQQARKDNLGGEILCHVW